MKRKYKVVSISTPGLLELELNDASKEGYTIVPNSFKVVIEYNIPCFMAILEKKEEKENASNS